MKIKNNYIELRNNISQYKDIFNKSILLHFLKYIVPQNVVDLT